MDGSQDLPFGPRPDQGNSSLPFGPRPAETQVDPLGQLPEESFYNDFTNAGAHVLKAMVGAGAAGLSEDQFSGPVQEELRKAKVIGPQSGQGSIVQQFNETVLKPLIMTGELGARIMQAGFGAYQTGAITAGEEAGAPALGRDVALLPEASLGFGHLGVITKARELSIIGAEGEKPVQGMREPPLPKLESTLPLEPDTAPKPTNVHELARQIDPDTFKVFDALQQRNEVLREQLSSLAEARGEVKPSPEAQALQDKADGILAKVNGVEARLTKKQATVLEDVRKQIAEAPSEQVDTPEMAEVRSQIQKNDYQMRDMALQISNAYDAAREQMPEVQPQPAPVEAVKEEAAPEVPKEILSSKGEVISTPQMVSDISSDVSQKLQAVGRPANEADLAAQLVALHYETRAKFFDGAKGSTADLYKNEGFDITGTSTKELPKPPEDLSFDQSGKILQGKTAFTNAKTIVKLFKSADASTFIHEMGHVWLNELMNDAKDEAAPQELRDMASAARKWMGVSEDLDMSVRSKVVTAAHEKWARAFERYLYDGEAPTPGLVKLFTQFREWLGEIKNKIARLAPISNEVKDIFDKLITPNPERQPVGKIEPIGKTLADIHEADAKAATPQTAGHIGDLVHSEIRETVKNHPNLERAVNGPEPGLERGTGSSNGNEIAKPGSEHTEPGGTATTAAPSEVSRGVSATEGKGEGGEGAAAGAQPAVKVEEPSTGVETHGATDERGHFTKSDSMYLNKAGNIRQDTLNAPDDIFKAAQDAAAANGNFMPARRGKLSLAEQKMLADDLGIDVIDSWKVGDAFNSSEILYVRDAFIDAATVVRDSMAKASETGNPADVAAFAKARARLIMIQEVLSGVTAEAGRALAAFRNVQMYRDARALSDFLRDTQGMDLFQMMEMAERGKGLKDTHQLSKFLQDSLKPDFSQRMIYYYVNALISGPLTHLRYSIGNAINAVARPLAVIPIAAAQGAVREALGFEVKDRVYLGEAGAQLHAMFKGAQDGIRAGAEALRTGQSPLLPGEKVRGGFNYSNNPIIQNWAYKKAVAEGLEGEKLQARMSELMKKPDFTAPEALLGEAVSYPGRSVSAIHSFFKSLRYEQNIAGLAYRTATKERLTGNAFDRRVAELTQRPTVEMMAEVTKNQPDLLPPGLRENINDATNDALKELYMRQTDYGTAMYHLAAAVNMTPAAKVIMPFLKIGTEIINEAIEYSPAELVRTAYSQEARQNLFGAGAKSDIARGKVIFGTALMGATSLGVLSGIITGDGPSNPRERENWLKLHKPNHITVGNISIPYQGLGHLGMVMRFAANVTDTVSGWDEKEGSQIAGEFFHDITRSVLDESWMRGAHDMMEAMYDEKGPTAARFIRSFATNWLPYSVGLSQVARAIDPYQRKVDDLGSENLWGILDAAQQKIPLLSMQLLPRRDSYGEPMDNSVGKYRNDPTTLMLDDLQTGIGYLPKKIAGVGLDEHQYDDYQRIAGRYTKALLDELSSNQDFLKMKPEAQIDVINKAIGQARRGAQNAMFAQYPSILEEATANAQQDIEE